MHEHSIGGVLMQSISSVVVERAVTDCPEEQVGVLEKALAIIPAPLWVVPASWRALVRADFESNLRAQRQHQDPALLVPFGGQ